MELIQARGRLMAIGGGEDKKDDCRILKEFVRLAGGEKALLAFAFACFGIIISRFFMSNLCPSGKT